MSDSTPPERCTIELVHPDYQPSKAGFRPVCRFVLRLQR